MKVSLFFLLNQVSSLVFANGRLEPKVKAIPSSAESTEGWILTVFFIIVISLYLYLRYQARHFDEGQD